MLNRKLFLVFQKYGEIINNDLLTDLYKPIIGKEAIDLYLTFSNEAKKQSIHKTKPLDLENFLINNKIDINKFNLYRNYLEAFNLLTTYLKTSENESNYYFFVNQPLSFSEFIQNPKFRHMLISSIGDFEYERLQYMYSTKRIYDAQNVSTTFDAIFGNLDIHKVSKLNFEKLYENIAKDNSIIVSIKPESKKIIENYFNSYNLSLYELQHVIVTCLQKNPSGIYEPNHDLLKIKFKDYIEKNINIDKIEKNDVKRDHSIFTSEPSNELLEAIFIDYEFYNSEQYLHSIFKSNLDIEEIKLINLLRSSFSLPDSLINMMLDFCTYKLKGKINKKYLVKMAKTINALNIKTPHELYNYLMYKEPEKRLNDELIQSGQSK